MILEDFGNSLYNKHNFKSEFYKERFIMYEFTTDCLTGIEQIDNEHRELFTLINQSIKMVSETDDINAIAKNLYSKT